MLGLFSRPSDARQNKQGMQKYGQRSDQAYNQLGDMIGEMSTQADQAYAEGDQTVQQRFGDIMEDQSQQINSQAASTKANLSRANMASGGDISGSTNVAMAGADQNANQAIQEAFNYYTRLNENSNYRDKTRGDRLLLNNAQTNQNQYQFDTGNRQNYELREIQRRQADRQTLASLLGAGLGVAGKAL